LLELEDDAGAELAAGAVEELSDPEPDLVPLSPEEEEEPESLLPLLSLELEELSFDPPSEDLDATGVFVL
jgi:hypothetical protein